ncbi:MAG: hypothetical protein ACREBU_23890 [Nitrososphaera sp.]
MVELLHEAHAVAREIERDMSHALIPSREQFLKGIEKLEKRERRDAMYKVASFLRWQVERRTNE